MKSLSPAILWRRYGGELISLHSLLFTAILSSSLSAPVHSQELGRLFFTPERRQALDHQRQFNLKEREEIPEDPMLTINGVVTRSSGKRTVWINGSAQDENDTTSGVFAAPARKDPGQINIQINESPATSVRVGSTVNRNTGEAADVLGNGQIRVRPRPTQ